MMLEEEFHSNSGIIEASSQTYKIIAKLQSMKDNHGVSLYSHVKDCISHIFSREPHYPVETFDLISKNLHNKSLIRPKEYENPATHAMSLIRKSLFVSENGVDEEPVIEEGVESPMPNILEVSHFLNRGNVGLSQIESVYISLAMKSLVEKYPVQSLRFWGKVFGLEQNYYIVEAEFAEGEDVEEDGEDENEQEEENAEASEEEENEEEVKDKLPKSSWKPLPKVPKEENNRGTNMKVYFVTHNPGAQWVRLPAVTPEQICIARLIRNFFTGNLDVKVLSSPPFPGTEANYLRAQIARISACTQVSPEGFYNFGDGEEEDEALEDENGERQKCSRNPDYEPLPIHELADPTLRNWVHHIPYILPQGRCCWWNPNRKAGDELEEIEEESEEALFGQISEPQRGPPILTHLSEDLPIFGKPSWTVRVHSELNPDYAVVTVCSTIWPGAHAIAYRKSYENIYIGWGVKAVGPGHDPKLPESKECMQEYIDSSGNLNETVDPTPTEEAVLRAAKLGDQVEEGMEEQEEAGGLEEEED